MSLRICIYVRPMLDASEEEQRTRLHAWANLNGHRVVAAFTEPERKRGLDRRREASRMLADAARGHWEGVACVSMLALCRSVTYASEALARLAASGVALIALDDGIDTRGDGGHAADAFALAARLEHGVHVERATIGARRRIEAGYPHGGKRVPATTEARIVSLIKAGTSTERIRRVVGCGKSTIYRVRAVLKAGEA